MTKTYCDACGTEGAEPKAMTLEGFTFDLGKDCIAKIRAVLDGKILTGTTVLKAVEAEPITPVPVSVDPAPLAPGVQS